MTILSNKSKPPPPQQQQSTTPNASAVVSLSAVGPNVSQQQGPAVSGTSTGISNSNTDTSTNAINESNILVQVGESLSAVTNVLVDSIGGKSASHGEKESDSGNGKAKNSSDNESRTVNIQISDIQNVSLH